MQMQSSNRMEQMKLTEQSDRMKQMKLKERADCTKQMKQMYRNPQGMGYNVHSTYPQGMGNSHRFSAQGMGNIHQMNQRPVDHKVAFQKSKLDEDIAECEEQLLILERLKSLKEKRRSMGC